MTRVLGLPQSIEIKRIEKKFRQGLLGPLLRQAGSEKTNKIPLFAPLRWGQACFLYGVKVGASPESSQNYGFRWSAHPSGGAECNGAWAVPCFLGRAVFISSSLEVAVGEEEWVKGGRLLFFYLVVHNLPNCTSMQRFSVLFFVIFVAQDVGSGASTAAKGPSKPLIIESRTSLTNEKLKPCVRVEVRHEEQGRPNGKDA